MTDTVATAPKADLVDLVYDYGVKHGVILEPKKLPGGWLPPLRYFNDGTELNHRWDYFDLSGRPHAKPFC